MHQRTGEKVTRRPIDRTPLNPDWLEFGDPAAKLEMSTLARYLEAEAPETEAEGAEDDGEEGGGAKEKELSVLDTLVEELKEIFEEDNYTTDDGREVPVEHVGVFAHFLNEVVAIEATLRLAPAERDRACR